MRVLYDISSLGLAQLYQQSRGGAFRVDLHLAEGLAASSECELLFCANHSAVAYRGCEQFLAGNPRLAAVPLISAKSSPRRLRTIRAAAGAAHRGVRRLFGSNVLPSPVRHLGRFVDARLHPRVTGTQSEVDILHSSPLAPLPPVSNRRPRRLLTLYDLAFVRFTALYGKAYRDALLNGIRSLQPSDHIITTSHFVRDEIADAGIASPDRVHVVPLAADPAIFYRCDDRERIAAVRRKYGVPEGPYALGVNTPDVRKNVPHAIHAFARACCSGRGTLSSLVLTGHHGSGLDRVDAAIAAHPQLRGRIIVTGYVPDEDLAPLYTGAHVFVYNSVYEGFGLPPLEAMQCGTPVVTSNTSSLPEVVGAGGVMVQPEDLDGLAGAMIDLASESTPRARLQQQALAQAGRFTWDNSVAATLRAYRVALQD